MTTGIETSIAYI